MPKKKWNFKPDHQHTQRISRDTAKLIDVFFNNVPQNLQKFIDNAIRHYCTCKLASNGHGKTGLENTLEGYEIRITALEKLAIE